MYLLWRLLIIHHNLIAEPGMVKIQVYNCLISKHLYALRKVKTKIPCNFGI